MTLQQEAYRRIDEMTDDGIRILIDMIDKMKTVSVTGFKDVNESTSAVSENVPMTKAEKAALYAVGRKDPDRCRGSQSAKGEEYDLMILADTNIFIDFWNNPTEDLKNVFIKEDIAVCGVVRANFFTEQYQQRISQTLQQCLRHLMNSIWRFLTGRF